MEIEPQKRSHNDLMRVTLITWAVARNTLYSRQRCLTTPSTYHHYLPLTNPLRNTHEAFNKEIQCRCCCHSGLRRFIKLLDRRSHAYSSTAPKGFTVCRTLNSKEGSTYFPFASFPHLLWQGVLAIRLTRPLRAPSPLSHLLLPSLRLLPRSATAPMLPPMKMAGVTG